MPPSALLMAKSFIATPTWTPVTFLLQIYYVIIFISVFFDMLKVLERMMDSNSKGNLILIWTSVLVALTSLKAAGGQASKERDSWKLK